MAVKNTPISPPNKQNEGRLLWVDLAKSFGLFLVFWGHSLYGGGQVADVINRAIYSFHMPMFFILSGYVTKPDQNTFWQYAKKKFCRIVLPALILYILAFPVFFILVDRPDLSLLSFIERIFYIKGECLGNKPVWFFFCLFQILIMVKLFDLPNYRVRGLVIMGVCSLVLSYLIYISKLSFFKLLGFDKCVLGLFFYVCGMMLKSAVLNKHIIRIGLILLPIWIVTGVFLNVKVRMYDMHLGSFWLFVLSGITGSLFFFSFCKIFEKFKTIPIVSTIGEYARWTVFIVSSHYILSYIFLQFFVKLSLLNTYIHVITSFCFVLIALLLYYPICRWVDKHIPVLI